MAMVVAMAKGFRYYGSLRVKGERINKERHFPNLEREAFRKNPKKNFPNENGFARASGGAGGST